MKRCIFIVEDRLTDIAGCLLTLQTILNAGLKKLPEDEWKDVCLCFLHVCEDGKDREGYESRFQSALRHSQEVMGENGLRSFAVADYTAVPLKQKAYESSNLDTLVDDIIARQKEHLKKCNFEAEFVNHFPAASSSDAAYVLLLDIILVQKDNEDQERIQNRQPILSSNLYSRFPKERCITYTNYSEYYGDKWADLAGVADGKVPIERERLTRARAIYTPLRKRLYQALGI